MQAWILRPSPILHPEKITNGFTPKFIDVNICIERLSQVIIKGCMASRLPLLKLEVVRGLQKASVEVVDAVEEEVVVVVGRWVVREVMLGTRRAARWWTRRSWRGGWTTSADGRAPGRRELHLEAGCQGDLLGGCVGFPTLLQEYLQAHLVDQVRRRERGREGVGLPSCPLQGRRIGTELPPERSRYDQTFKTKFVLT